MQKINKINRTFENATKRCSAIIYFLLFAMRRYEVEIIALLFDISCFLQLVFIFSCLTSFCYVVVPQFSMRLEVFSSPSYPSTSITRLINFFHCIFTGFSGILNCHFIIIPAGTIFDFFRYTSFFLNNPLKNIV